MSAPASTSDTIVRGADYAYAFQIRENGPFSPLADLTDWTWSAVLRNAAGASLADLTVTNPTAEVVSFGLTHTQTAALAAQSNATLIINAVRPDNWHMQLIRSRITLL
jgi:hypothetical protein